MLAATPDPDSTLGLFQVVLNSVDNDQSVDISDYLKRHVVDILHTASEIATNPARIGAGTPSEAIELAFRIRDQEGLTREIANIGNFDNIRAALAHELLKTIQPLAA
jgi:hypothetical protein